MSLANLDFENRPQHPMGSKKPSKVRSDFYNLDILDLARRKFGLISFFVLIGIALATVYYFKAPKTYESTAKIFVDEKNAPAMSGSDRDSFVKDDSIEKYLETLKSSIILKPAIENGKFYEMDLFSRTDDILVALRESGSFSAKPADARSNSGVIKVTYRGNTPDECTLVLQEIIDSFSDHIKSTTKDIGSENAELVQRANTEWLGRLKEVEQEIEGLMVRPELLNVEGKIINPYQMDLSMMRKDLHDLRSERNKLLARLENVKRDQSLGRNSDDLINEIMADESNVSDSAYVRINDQLVKLSVEEQDLLNQFGNDHPQLKAVRRKINTVEQMLQKELTAMRGSRTSGTASLNVVDNFMIQMERKVSMLTSEEQQIQSEIVRIQTKSTSVSALVEKLNALQRERSRLETGYYALIERMSEVNAFKEHLWRNLSVLDPPSVAEKVAPKLSICLAAGLSLGGLAGLAFAGFKDMAEKTFRSSDDVGVLLDTPVIGHISFFQKLRNTKRSDAFPNVKSEVVAVHAPSSQISEAYRAIRTSIFFKAQESKAKVIQVTSPTPGDGKSTTISNLAASIAQSGRTVLLIDADLRKPTQHALFGVENKHGLSSVISGEKTFSEVIQPIIPDVLSIVSAGPIPGNPAELLTSPGFAQTIQDYRKGYDFVLIDTPPLLAVTDPSIVCSHADLVFMVMRIRNGVRTNSLRAKDLIDSMGVQLSGVVINGVRRKDEKTYAYSNQYGYGTYGYGQPSKGIQQSSSTQPFARLSKHNEKTESNAS